MQTPSNVFNARIKSDLSSKGQEAQKLNQIQTSVIHEAWKYPVLQSLEISLQPGRNLKRKPLTLPSWGGHQINCFGHNISSNHSRIPPSTGKTLRCLELVL